LFIENARKMKNTNMLQTNVLQQLEENEEEEEEQEVEGMMLRVLKIMGQTNLQDIPRYT
jgi:hypothetical protein